MKEKLIEQAGKELKVAAWVDLLIMVVAVVVTLHLGAIAAVTAGMSAGSFGNPLSGGVLGMPMPATSASHNGFHATPFIIMVAALAAVCVINWFGIRMLLKNKAQRAKATDGLAKLYKDEAVDQYADGAVYKSYENRYNLFAVVMGSVGGLSIIATLAIFINQLTKL